MRLEKLKKHRKHNRWLDGIFTQNPVFACGMALPLAVMATYNLKSAVSISILLACATIPTVLLAAVAGRFLPNWLSPIVYTMFAMVLVVTCMPLILMISPEVTDSLGLYVPVVAVNSLLLALCTRYSRAHPRPIMALVDALAYSIGFAVAAAVIGVIRELLGNASIWGKPVSLPFKVEGLQYAFAGFILVAVVSAMFRFLRRAFFSLAYRHENPPEEKAAS